MSNITDYVVWRGDLTFAERPFNELDNLVLSQLAYIDMSSAFPEGEIIAVQDVIQVLLDRNCLVSLVADGIQKKAEYEAFAKAAAASKRFGRLLISNYVDILDQERQVQFAAMTFRLDKDTAYIAFRGTDDSLVGWKEDFMLSFDRIPAQEQALSYVRRSWDPELHYYIGGHSKGANLALYAGCLLTDEEREQVLHIYVNDGPGLCPDVMDTSLIRKIDPLTTKIVPEYDVIGKIFEMPISDNRIVKSSASGVLQHGILTWQLNPNGLELVPSNAPGSLWIGHVIDQWISSVEKVEDRKTFIDDLFQTLEASGVRNFNEMTEMGPESLERMVETALQADPVTVSVAKALPVAAVTGQGAGGSIGTRLRDLLQNSLFARAVLLIACGLGGVLLPGGMLPLTIAMMMTGFVALELIYTVRRFIEVHGDMKVMQMQAYICMASVAVYLMLLIKDNALMLVSNVVFGLFFLFLAYHIVGRVKELPRRGWRWYWRVTEAFLLIILGSFILFAPEKSIPVFTFSAGLLFLADGMVHLADAIRREKERRKK